MPPEAVHVVIRSTGQYEDYRTEVICSYADRDLAELHAKRAGEMVVAAAELYRQAWEKYTDDEGATGMPKFPANPFDSQPDSDASYYVTRVPMLTACPGVPADDRGGAITATKARRKLR